MAPFEKRKIEWMMHGGSSVYGAGLMLPYESLSYVSAFNSHVLTYFNEFTWGLSFFAVGIAGIMSLLINGRSSLTPFFRFVSSFLLGILLIHYAYLFSIASPLGTGVLTYGVWLGGIGGTISMYGASKDMINEIELWRMQRNGNSEPE